MGAIVRHRCLELALQADQNGPTAHGFRMPHPARAGLRLGRVGLGLASLLVVGCGGEVKAAAPATRSDLLQYGSGLDPVRILAVDTVRRVICYGIPSAKDGWAGTYGSLSCVKVTP